VECLRRWHGVEHGRRHGYDHELNHSDRAGDSGACGSGAHKRVA
jgi:hypothetical protein